MLISSAGFEFCASLNHIEYPEVVSSRLKYLQEMFTNLGIKNLVPGFYDDPAFVHAENRYGSLLDHYAEYCIEATANQSYRDIAAQRISDVVSFLSPLVAIEKGAGKCMATTLLLQRILDQENVWNFPQKGGVVVKFPPESMLSPKFLPPENGSVGTYGHAWVLAPPFRVIDLTIARQFYTTTEQAYINGDLLAENVEPEARFPFSGSHGEPGVSVRSRFPPFAVRLGACEISYYPYGTGGPIETFPQMNSPVLGGFRPFELYQQYVQKKSPKRPQDSH